jgi:hypothetical protein
MVERRAYTVVLLVLALCIGTSSLAPAEAVQAADAQAPESEASQQLRSAQRTQLATRGSLRLLSGASRCSDSRYVAYRRSDREPEIVDPWYVVSQLWADAALLAVNPDQMRAQASIGRPRAAEFDERDARCHLDKGFVFLDRLWDDDEGGYYPRSNANGSKVSRQSQYADDNALAGLALLAAADAVPAGRQRDYYVNAALQEAEYLAESGLWDDVFGGGFWWSTGRGDTDEGKPAQSNALAALFFARLFQETGNHTFRGNALSTLAWLDSALFDEGRNLYRWSVRYERPSDRAGGPIRSERYFNYDQAIAIEAQLLVAGIDGDGGRVSRARAIGDALHASFWNSAKGGYNLEAGVDQVYTSYAAWASFGHLALYSIDGDARWLDMARANAAALRDNLAESDGGYALRQYRCTDGRASGCGGRSGWTVDRTRDTAAHAWAQHLQTVLARTVTSR